MTVHTSGPITILPADFQRTDRGIHWAIKAVNNPAAQWVSIYLVSTAGVVSAGPSLDDGFDTSRGYQAYMNIEDWWVHRALPNLNKWLAATFPPLTGSPVEPVLSPIEQADALITGRLQITQAADGTLSASLPP